MKLKVLKSSNKSSEIIFYGYTARQVGVITKKDLGIYTDVCTYRYNTPPYTHTVSRTQINLGKRNKCGTRWGRGRENFKESHVIEECKARGNIVKLVKFIQRPQPHTPASRSRLAPPCRASAEFNFLWGGWVGKGLALNQFN